jgi:DNA-binding transcriptional regulator YiaG
VIPRSQLRRAREVIRGIISCPLCGRSGGAIRAGHEACEKCRAELAPTKLESFRQILGLSVKDIATHAGVTTMTVHRALRGEPLGMRAARALSRVTRIPVEVLALGEPSPFRKREP